MILTFHLRPRVDPTIRIRTIKTSTESIAPVIARILMQSMKNDDVMIQCISCEDWFHGQHLEGPVPESYGELICKDCTSRMDFLKYYQEEMLKVTDG